MGYYYGYNRVSSKEQHEDRGNASIENFCKSHNYPLERIYVDKQTGKNFDRARYRVLKEDVLRTGDTLIVAEYDRLGRADETKTELEYYKENGIRVIFLDIPTTQMDFSLIEDNMAKMILNCINEMLISFYDCLARSELERKKKRQREGYEALKNRGEWDKLGRPRKMSKEQFAIEYQKVVNGEMKTSELMKKLSLKENTYYRYVREYRATHREEKDKAEKALLIKLHEAERAVEAEKEWLNIETLKTVVEENTDTKNAIEEVQKLKENPNKQTYSSFKDLLKEIENAEE